MKLPTENFLNIVYPVGSIYWSSKSTNPANLFGGTWTQITDKFVLAAGSTYLVNETGGEATHTLTTSEMPSHTHTVTTLAKSTTSSTYSSGSSLAAINSSSSTTSSTGGGSAHNNMPPYIVKYCWERTA